MQMKTLIKQEKRKYTGCLMSETKVDIEQATREKTDTTGNEKQL